MTHIVSPSRMRDLAAKYHEASAAWEDHFRATGIWCPEKEKAMVSAHRAYLRAQDAVLRAVDDREEEE